MRRKEIVKLGQSLRSWQDGVALFGECVIQFQRIEEALSICISAMIGRSRRIGEIVTTEMSFRARVATFGALFLHALRTESLPQEITELIQRLQWAERERNTLVHSLWDASETNPDSIHRSKKTIRRSEFTKAQEHVTPDDLDDLNRLFGGIVTDLFYLTANHQPNLHAKLRYPAK